MIKGMICDLKRVKTNTFRTAYTAEQTKQ